MWRRKTVQEGEARTRFFVARAAEGGETFTVLLDDDFFPPFTTVLRHGRRKTWNNFFNIYFNTLFIYIILFGDQ